MKTIKTLTLIWIICFATLCQAQTKQTTTDSTNVKPDNFLDMGAEVITQVFGTELDGNATGKTLSYLELLNQSDLPEDQKTEIKNLYYLQAQELTEKQKDSLGKAIEKQILEAKQTDDD
ncbi:hypothetical protein [Olleya sp. R77988]|uniref:hypothetical protein n=1 Tax=Olleya sp. R77988 TaxID=3093875 RepID=UPI0037CC2572